MKAFKFRLESVLHLRKNKVNQEIAGLSEVVGEINKLKVDIERNTSDIQKEYLGYDKQILEGNSLYYLRIFDNYIKGLQNKNDQLEKEIESHHEELEEARRKVLEARKEAEVLEIIKKKQQDIYEDKLRRQERYELEEINHALHEKQKKEANNEHQRNHKEPLPKEDKKVKPVIEKPKSQYDQLMDFVKPKK